MMTYLMLIAGLALLVLGADLLVKGASRIAAGFGIPPLIIGLTIVAFAFSIDGRISFLEGALFLVYYVAYTTYLILAATEHDALPEFSYAMIYFVVPLTIVTLVIVLLREYSAHHRPRAEQ